MGTKAAVQEVEALEAALEFIAQYELSVDEQSNTDSDNFWAEGVAVPARHVKDLTAKFQFHRAHSLESPSQFASTDFFPVDGASDGVLESLFEPIGVGEPIGDVQALAAPSIQVAIDQSVDLGQVSDAPASSSTLSSPDVAALVKVGGAMDGRRLDSATARLLKVVRPQKPQPVSRRQELQDLRETVKDLTQKLESLRASGGSPTAEASEYVCSILSQSESVWEQVAARQLAARCRAEEENQRLWAVVDQQVRYAKNLKRKLRRQVRDNEVGRLLITKRLKPLTAQESKDVLAELECNMGELYVGVDKQFADAEMHNLPCPGRKRQVRRNAVNGIFIELLDCNPVPFELRTTEKAVWTSLGERGLRYRHGRSLVCKTASETDSTIMSSYEFNVHAFDDYHCVRCHRVARKYVEESRSVIVCQTVLEPLQQQSGDPVGLKFLEVQLLSVTSDDQTPSDSVIQSLMSITRLELDGEPVKRYRADAYIDIAINGWNQSKSKDNQLIENLLMEELLALS